MRCKAIIISSVLPILGNLGVNKAFLCRMGCFTSHFNGHLGISIAMHMVHSSETNYNKLNGAIKTINNATRVYNDEF